MMFGMNEQQFELLKQLVITPLKESGAQVFIFGSRAEGKHHPYSDVDLLYKCDSPLPPGLLSNINEAIEESRFPFTVDVVADSDLAESYRKNVESQLKKL